MIKYPAVDEAKQLIVEIGRRMYERGYVASNDGNISCRIAPDKVLATPTGVSKGYMSTDMMLELDMDGKEISPGGPYRPTSEIKMHLRAYRENPDIMAVTHAHPPVATSFAIAGIELDSAILPEAVVNLGTVPVARYATPGTQDVPDSIAPFCKDYNAVLLANHGALTWGASLMEAYHRMESLEYYATVTMYTKSIIGRANVLSSGQVEELLKTRKALGIKTGGIPVCAPQAPDTEKALQGGGAFSEEQVRLVVEQVTRAVLSR